MARLTVLEQIAGAHRVLPLNPARVATTFKKRL